MHFNLVQTKEITIRNPNPHADSISHSLTSHEELKKQSDYAYFSI